MNPAQERCQGGHCNISSTVRCPQHAALYACEAMQERGWVALPYKVNDVAPAMAELARDVPMEMQAWASGYDHSTLRMTESWWVPGWASLVLTIYLRSMPVASLVLMLRSLKRTPLLVDTLAAAHTLGGLQAAEAVIKDNMPGLLGPWKTL